MPGIGCGATGGQIAAFDRIVFRTPNIEVPRRHYWRLAELQFTEKS